MQLYQLDYLVSPQSSEQDAQSVGERIKSLIEKRGGSIVRTEPLVRQMLAYKIKKFNEAFLAGLIFNLKPEELKGFEKELSLEKNILRHLIFKKKLVKAKKKRRKTTKKSESEEVKILKDKPKRKVELKEIEKKLEEILGDH